MRRRELVTRMWIRDDARELDVVVSLRSDNHHRALCFTYDVFADRAEKEALDAGLAVRTDKQQVGADLACDPEDLLRRTTDARVYEELDLRRFATRKTCGHAR